MLKNYLTLAWRNLLKNKMHSLLNISGLSAGMAVAILIGLWVWDEVSFDKYHKNYDSIAQVMLHQTLNNEVMTQGAIPIPVGEEMRTTYSNLFKKVVMSSPNEKHILSVGDNKFVKTGNYMQAEAPALFGLKVIEGNPGALKDPSAIMLSQSVAVALFGADNPIGKLVKFDDDKSLKVAAVYEDLPLNTTLRDITFIAPWDIMPNLHQNLHNWGNHGWLCYVQMADNTDIASSSLQIRDAKLKKENNGDERFKPALFLQPISKWHLYAEFKNGINVGGRIQYVWLFSVIGVFVLLLACINFMNLSTARSEKRAKEVGIRKAIGSLRRQLIYQFFCESIMAAFIAFAFCLLVVLCMLPFFNSVSGKQMHILWGNVYFWLCSAGFSIIVGLIAGSYPALYLSSFQPVKVLKGTFKAGRYAALPRKALIVLQFSVSVVLIICTIIVFRQIQFAKNRAVGYSKDGLIAIENYTPAIHQHFDAFHDDLLKTGVVTEAAESSTPVTDINNSQSNFDWEGKNPNSNTQNFNTVGISKQFGKTIGWQFVEGRDYRSGPEGADALAFVVNEAAAKAMGFKNAVGKTVHWSGYTFTIIGVAKDMVMQSPYEPVVPTIFYMAPWRINIIDIKLNTAAGTSEAIAKVEQVFKRYNPSQPFEYKFADDEYARKFDTEERVGKLATFFAALAIFISCLGLFGMASFMAEQRVKEIGVRKVLGASVFNLWQLLSGDFLVLVIISIIIAVPAAYLFMHSWLQHYTYRSPVAWWIFAATGAGALVITLVTVSYQGVKAALANPVRSLRSE